MCVNMILIVGQMSVVKQKGTILSWLIAHCHGGLLALQLAWSVCLAGGNGVHHLGYMYEPHPQYLGLKRDGRW